MEIQIRQLTPDDWQIYQDIRLESLREHPEFFCPSQDETKFSEQTWRDRLKNPVAASFAAFDGPDAVAIATIFQEGNDPQAQKAHLVAMYTKSSYRKKGLAQRLIARALDWARAREAIQVIEVWNRCDNEGSRRSHQKFGFQFVSSAPFDWPDGQNLPGECYQLRLREGTI